MGAHPHSRLNSSRAKVAYACDREETRISKHASKSCRWQRGVNGIARAASLIKRLRWHFGVDCEGGAPINNGVSRISFHSKFDYLSRLQQPRRLLKTSSPVARVYNDVCTSQEDNGPSTICWQLAPGKLAENSATCANSDWAMNQDKHHFCTLKSTINFAVTRQTRSRLLHG